MIAAAGRATITECGALALAPREAIAPRAMRPADAALLEVLRDLARAAQLSAPMDLDVGCALIAARPEDSLRAHGAALLRAVDASALRSVTFHRRAGGTLAFGEAWLLALVTALRDGDADSAVFLATRMIRRERRRVVLWLAERFATALREIAPSGS